MALVPGSGSALYYVEDSLGSSRVIATASAVCYDGDFTPFGGERAYTSTCSQNYKFEGKERDTETQNDDFGGREYSWRFGRWLSSDWSAVPVPVPYANLTNPQTLNLYAMVTDDPESFADLDGHDPQVPGAQNNGQQQTGQNCTPAGTQCPAQAPPPPPPPAQNQRDDGLGLVRDFLDIVEVSVSAGVSAKASGQFGVAEYGAEATLIGGEASSGLGGGNADASVVSKAKAWGKIGDAEAGVEVGGKVSARDGASASASANAGVGPAQVGGSISVNREGGHVQPAAAASRDFKVGASVRAGVGVGVNINFSQGARAVQHLYNVFAQIGGVVLPRVPDF